MADISAQVVKELRERTGAGMMDCKRRERERWRYDQNHRMAAAEGALPLLIKKAGRVAAEDGSCIKPGGQVGVL